MGIPAKELLRDKEPVFREMELAKKADKMTEDELIGLMIRQPDLMQRPIVEIGDRAVIARPIEKIHDIL